MKNIAFISLGWLGESLADWCSVNGYNIFGTTTSLDKKQRLESNFSQVIQLNINQSSAFGGFSEAIDLLLYSIPPSVSEEYVAKSRELISTVVDSNKAVQIIYISSTSVYGQQARLVTEQSEVSPETKNALKMVELENFLFKNYGNKTAVLRCGGLVGKKRHPVKYLSGKTGVAKPGAKVNLVHLQDLLGFFQLLVQNFSPGVYNLVSPKHVDKKEYYNWAAQVLKIEGVQFEEDKIKDKIVTCPAVTQLKYNYLFPSPYDYPLA